MAIIKVALTGDVHLGVPKRADEAMRIARWMGEDWKARGVHLIGIGGDLVDGPMTERERAKLIELIDFYSQIAPVVINDGNHEVEFALRNALGKIPNVTVEDGAGIHLVETEAGPIAVACVSFPKKAALLAAVGPVSGEEAERIAGQALQDVFRGIGARLETEFRLGGAMALPCVALVHGTIRGSKIDADQPDRPLGLDMALPDVALMGADFYCVPHIHLAQQWEYNGVTFATPSSPFYCDYGEAKHEKGYILAEFEQVPFVSDDMDATRYAAGTKTYPAWRVKWQRIPTPATPMLLVEGTWSDEPPMIVINGGRPSDDSLKGADVRFRFHFPSDKRKAAMREAEGWAEMVKEHCGTVNITLDPIQTPTTRSRIPELTTTVRLEDKLKLYWKAIGLEPGPERESALLETLGEMQVAAAAKGISMGSTGRTAPVMKKFRGKGFLKFPNEFAVDFGQLGDLTAIIAPNETGKTVLMQLMGPGLLYGKTATRGSLDDLSIAKDSFIEGEFTMAGAEYKLVQNANGIDRKGSVSLIKNGKPELGNKSAGGRDEYSEWAAKNILPQNVYNAVICQSDTDSIIDLKDGPRVELLLRVLGLEIYEALAEMARNRASEASTELAGVRARIEELGVGDIEQLRERVISDFDMKGRCKGSLIADEAELELKRGEKAEADKKRAEYDRLVAQRAELTPQISSLRDRISQLQGRIAVSQEIVDEKEAIEKAVAEIAALESEIAAQPVNELQVQLATESAALERLKSEHAGLERRAGELRAQDDELARRLAAIETQIEDAKAVVADADAIRKAVAESAELTASLRNKEEERSAQRVREAELAGLLTDVRARFNANAKEGLDIQRAIAAAEAVVGLNGYLKSKAQASAAALAKLLVDIETKEVERARYWTEVESLQAGGASSSDTRISKLREGHTEIVQGADPIPRAAAALETDEELAAEAEDTPARIEAAKQQWHALGLELKDLRAALALEQKEAARLPEIEAAEKNLADYRPALEANIADHESLTTETNQVIASQDELATQIEQTKADIRWLDEKASQLVPLVARAKLLATAEIQIKSLEEQATVIRTDRVAISASADALNVDLDGYLARAAANAATLLDLRQRLEAAQREVATRYDKITALKPTAHKASQLAVAEANIETLLHQKSSLDKELEVIEHKSDQLERQIDDFKLPDPIDLAPFETAVNEARAALTDIQTRLAVAERELQDAEDKEGRRQELAGQVRGLEDWISNYTALAQHLGKDGLQKEEISCAGPQLTETTNDLLRAAGDTRHTVSIETEKLHSNKKQMIPCLNIMVYDSEEGITKESRYLSGAGKVIVGEPLSLAMVRLGCQRAGITAPTIFRDEATGMMDKVNGPRYVGMVRRFMEILGGAQVLFISQSPDIQALADSSITIEAGRLEII